MDFGAPFPDLKFDFIICDGHVPWPSDANGNAIGTKCEHRLGNARVMYSQLILTLQRVRNEGTVVVCLYKIDAWDSIEILSHFDRFSTIRFFKPCCNFAEKSSFYLIAERVQLEATAIAIQKLEEEMVDGDARRREWRG